MSLLALTAASNGCIRRTRRLTAGFVSPQSSRAGFTLIEILLAVTVFAVVLVAVHAVFYSALSLRNKTSAALEASVPLQHTLEIIKRDVANLVPPGETFFGPLQSAPLTGSLLGQFSQSSATVDRANLPGRIVSPELYTTAGIIDDYAPWGELERVTYYLADPTNNAPGKDLVRSVTRNLLPIVEDQSEPQWLLGGVQDLVFLFFDGLQWIDTWDSTTAPTPLPTAIKVQLQLAPTESNPTPSSPIELVVPLLVQASTNQTDTLEEGGS